MNCRKAERWILMSFDRDLSPAAGRALAGHLVRCPKCRQRAGEYGRLRDRLAVGRVPGLPPRFWERLESRLDQPAAAPGAVWARLWAEAIPISLSLLAGFLLASLFLAPSSSPASDLTGAQALVMTGESPIVETREIFEEGRREVRDLTLLFAGNEVPNGRN